MKHAFMGALLLLVGCGRAGVRQVQTAGGKPIYEAKCQSSSAECIADAHSTCRDGYESLDSESHAGGVLADAMPGPVTWYVLTFRCGSSPSAARPDFPFRGHTYQAPAFEADRPRRHATTPVRATMPSRASSTPAPETAHGSEWSSDLACGVGYVCAKPVGSFSGECARAVDGMSMPVFTSPRANMGPGERQCHFATDCGIGFDCNQGRCIKR